MKLLRRQKGKKGFTLVEMMIVVAILLVIMSFAVPSVVSYTKRINLKELDDSARSIYMAAQNRLMTLRSSGAELDFVGAVYVDEADIPEIYKKEAYDSDGNLMVDESGNVMYDVYADAKFSYIKSEDIKTFNSGAEGNENLSIVNLSSIESQLYENDFIIEYDATTGFVFGVFYAEDDESLASFSPKDIERGFEDRLKLEHTYGYYGGGKLVQVPKGGVVKKATLEFYDREKLVVRVNWPTDDDPAITSADKIYFTLNIKGYDKRGNPASIDIISKLDKCYISKAIEEEKQEGATIILDSLAPGLGADHGMWNLPYADPSSGDRCLSSKVIERDFKGWVYEDFLYEGSGVYRPIYPSYDGDTSTSWLKDGYPTDRPDDGNTSRPYVIDPGTDITVTVTFYDVNGIQLAVDSEPMTVNSYFKSLEDSTAYITAGRHLQNLANYVIGSTVMKAKIVEDIDFSDSAHEYNSWNADVTYKNYYDFKPIGSQFVDKAQFLQELDGNGKKLSYLKIDSTQHEFPEGSAGLENTAFITNLYDAGNVHDIVFYRPWIHGETKNTAVFTGYADAGVNIKNITIINPLVEGGLPDGEAYVGTLCAHYNGGGINNCEVRVEKYEDNYNFNGNDMSSSNYKESLDWSDPTNDPYSKFGVVGLHEQTYAGGLIGRNDQTINGVYCAIRVESKGVAGGLIGLNTGGAVNNCYVGGHTYEGSYIGEDYCLINIKGDKAAGGFIGENRGGSMTSDSSTASVNWLENGQGDSFFGISGSNGPDNGYALGWIIDPATQTAKSKSSKYVNNIKNVMNPASCQSVPYDPFLEGRDYPYNNDPTHSVRIGDWPVDPPAMGVFYWEKDGSGKVYVQMAHYNAKTGESDPIDNLSENTGRVADFGYGYFYTDDVLNADDSMMVNVGEQCGDENVKKAVDEIVDKDLNLSAAHIVLRRTNVQNINAVKMSLRFDYMFRGTAGTQTFYFDPGFCGVSTHETLGDRTETAGSDEPYQIRCEAQFKNIEHALASSFVQTKPLTLGNAFTQVKPIGSMGGYFSGRYRVDPVLAGSTNITLEGAFSTQGVNAIGLFGVARNADISGIKLDCKDKMISITRRAYVDGGKIGAGGIAGIAIGGSISDCTVTNLIIDAGGNDVTVAMGGIAGFSSATIHNCIYTGDSNSITANSSYSGSDIYTALGGIAGSASGSITGCTVENMKTYCMTNEAVLYAGGIVGNNLSFTGETYLSVSACTSKASLTRPSEELSSGEGKEPWHLYKYKVLIHPIAPDDFTLDLNDEKLYDMTEFVVDVDGSAEADKRMFLATIGVITPDLMYETEQISKINFVTGSGVIDVSQPEYKEPTLGKGTAGTGMSVNTVISDCQAYQGADYYNSRVRGNSPGVHMISQTPEPTLITTDVYVFRPPMDSISFVEYTETTPEVKLFALYEKNDGSNIGTVAELYEAGSYKPEGNFDTLDQYGIVTNLGRIEDLDITFDGAKAESIPGQPYSGKDGKSIMLNADTFCDFSPIIADRSGTITVTYKDTTIATFNITVEERAPYTGVYSLYEKQNSADYMTGRYTDRDHYGDTAYEMSNAGDGTLKNQYGIMLERSTIKPHSLDELTVHYEHDGKDYTINQADLHFAGANKYRSVDYKEATAYGKQFEFYNIDGSVFDKLPENEDVTIKVLSKKNVLLAQQTFKTEIKIPYLGLYGIAHKKYTNPYGVTQNDFIQYVITHDNSEVKKADNIKFKDFISEEETSNVGVGIILEEGYDLSKVTVELSGGKSATIKGTQLEAATTGALDAGSESYQAFQTTVNGKTLKLYQIPDDLIPEGTTSVKVTYEGYKDYTAEAKVSDDLGCSVKGHEHKYGSWQKVDEKTHSRKCEDPECPIEEGREQTEAHNFKGWTETGENKFMNLCPDCGYNETVENHDHELVQRSDENYHWKTCTAEGCPLKGLEISKTAHTYRYEQIENNETQHKRVCSVCERDGGYENHDLKYDHEDEDSATIIYKCSKCGYETKEVKPSDDKVVCCGIYVIGKTGLNSWDVDVANAYFRDKDELNKAFAFPDGKAGILIADTLVDDVKVEVDGVSVKSLGQKESRDLIGNAANHYYWMGNGNPIIDGFRIPDEYLNGKEKVTVTIKRLNDAVIFSKEIFLAEEVKVNSVGAFSEFTDGTENAVNAYFYKDNKVEDVISEKYNAETGRYTQKLGILLPAGYVNRSGITITVNGKHVEWQYITPYGSVPDNLKNYYEGGKALVPYVIDKGYYSDSTTARLNITYGELTLFDGYIRVFDELKNYVGVYSLYENSGSRKLYAYLADDTVVTIDAYIKVDSFGVLIPESYVDKVDVYINHGEEPVKLTKNDEVKYNAGDKVTGHYPGYPLNAYILPNDSIPDGADKVTITIKSGATVLMEKEIPIREAINKSLVGAYTIYDNGYGGGKSASAWYADGKTYNDFDKLETAVPTGQIGVLMPDSYFDRITVFVGENEVKVTKSNADEAIIGYTALYNSDYGILLGAYNIPLTGVDPNATKVTVTIKTDETVLMTQVVPIKEEMLPYAGVYKVYVDPTKSWAGEYDVRVIARKGKEGSEIIKSKAIAPNPNVSGAKYGIIFDDTKYVRDKTLIVKDGNGNKLSITEDTVYYEKFVKENGNTQPQNWFGGGYTMKKYLISDLGDADTIIIYYVVDGEEIPWLTVKLSEFDSTN